jgi:hypothetical protein
MFARRDGPTALKAELIWALAFSQTDGEIETPQGKVRACAGLAAVWDGKLGQVLVLVRFVDYGHVDRFAFQRRISSEQELAEAVEAALHSAAGMGLPLDAPEFSSLEADARKRRLRRWNELRTPGAPGEGFAVSRGSRPTADLSPREKADGDGRAVLGRVAVVRRRVEKPGSEEPVGGTLPRERDG